ncbi:MAG: hypothetical protein L0L69_04700 [Propionibacterium sp.]|nr:hypothetical protein [Propionibacterium sp.]
MHTRTLTAEDLATGPAWMDDPLIHRDHWRDSSTRALVAVENGRSVGVATMWVPAANAATYRWTHAAWAPTADGFEDVLAEVVRTEVDQGATSVALDPQRRPLALTVVSVDCDPPVITAETVAPDIPDGERLLGGCPRRSFDVLASRGLSSVELDGHVSDPHLLPVWVRLEPTGQWFHLVEIPVDEV